jgi:hypothetical protein
MRKCRYWKNTRRPKRRFGSCLKSKLSYTYVRFYKNLLGKHIRVTKIVRICFYNRIGEEKTHVHTILKGSEDIYIHGGEEEMLHRSRKILIRFFPERRSCLRVVLCCKIQKRTSIRPSDSRESFGGCESIEFRRRF